MLYVCIGIVQSDHEPPLLASPTGALGSSSLFSFVHPYRKLLTVVALLQACSLQGCVSFMCPSFPSQKIWRYTA